eukprot:COSAG02_NODE_1019_length_15171_cov_7.663482_6_plen_47_part_00
MGESIEEANNLRKAASMVGECQDIPRVKTCQDSPAFSHIFMCSGAG